MICYQISILSLESKYLVFYEVCLTQDRNRTGTGQVYATTYLKTGTQPFAKLCTTPSSPPTNSLTAPASRDLFNLKIKEHPSPTRPQKQLHLHLISKIKTSSTTSKQTKKPSILFTRPTYSPEKPEISFRKKKKERVQASSKKTPHYQWKTNCPIWQPSLFSSSFFPGFRPVSYLATSYIQVRPGISPVSWSQIHSTQLNISEPLERMPSNLQVCHLQIFIPSQLQRRFPTKNFKKIIITSTVWACGSACLRALPSPVYRLGRELP